MFWKVFGGIVIFFMVVALAVGLLATVSVAAVGVAVGAAIDSLESSTVQVIDSSGRMETYSVNDLLSGTERLEVYGDNGELVTIDTNLPQITVQEGGKDAATVIINGDEAGSVVIDGEKGIEIGADGSHIRIDGVDIGRDVDSFNNFDGGHLGRFIAELFRGMFNLVLLSMILVGIWLLVRNQRSKTVEKTPDVTA